MKKITKKDLNQNIRLSEGNLASTGNDEIMFLTWSLPSRSTCTYATEMCKKRCFAKKNESFKNVRDSRSRNLEETYKDTFVQDMIKHFEYHLQRPKTQDKLVIVRIHTSGDFYNLEYFNKWVEISDHFKNNKKIMFQAYTKSMPVLKEYLEVNTCNLQDINIHLVWSVWKDTKKEYTEYAKSIEMQVFTSLPKDEIGYAVQNGAFACKDLDCGVCKECYIGTSKEIVIPYH